MRDLCEVTDCIANGWTGLTQGRGINNHGDIVGDGVINGVSHAFLAIKKEFPWEIFLPAILEGSRQE
jgi:hypothetical protein